MTASVSLPKDVACTPAAKDVQRANASPRDLIGEILQTSWTTHTKHSNGGSYNATVSQTPRNTHIAASPVHISHAANDFGNRAVSQCPSSLPRITVSYTDSDSNETLNEEANPFSDSSHIVLHSAAEAPPSYAALHDIADDGKTFGCDRTITFDSFVEKAQLNDDDEPLKDKRRRRDRFQDWIKARAASLRLVKKP